MGMEGKPNNWVTTSEGKKAQDVQVYEVSKEEWKKRVKEHEESKTDKPYPFKTQESQYKDLVNKIIIAKGELSDILNRKPLVKSDREEASMVRDNIKSLEKDLENYNKSQLN
jgi:protein-arginine kinase activator protein McsA